MPYFIKRIVTKAGVLEFHFDRISTTENIKYHVSVVVEGNAYHFTMQPDSDHWKIVSAPLPPEWIVKLEDQFSAEILRHLNSF